MKVHAPRGLDFDEVPEANLEDADFSLGADTDDGLVAPMIADDPEHDRLVDPED